MYQIAIVSAPRVAAVALNNWRARNAARCSATAVGVAVVTVHCVL